MNLLRPRQRKLVTLVTLGCWLFSFFAGVVNACELVREIAVTHHASTGAAHHHESDDATPSGCEQFCANDVAIPAAKVNLFEHQSADQALLLAPMLGVTIVTGATPVPLLLDHPDPPPGIALYARFLRLAL